MILKPRISGDITYKRRWEYIGAIIGIVLGYPLYLITLLIPHYSTDSIYEGLTIGLPELLKQIDPLLGALPFLLKGIFMSINDISQSNPYYPITFFFISYIEFPSCLAWIIPGFLIGYYRNRQFYNLEIKNNGWNVFWHGIKFLQVILTIFSIGLISMFLLSLLPGASLSYEVLIAFFGSGVLKVLTFFISPFFWLGLLLSGIGGTIGTKLAIKKTSPSEIVIEEVVPEEVFHEEEEFFAKSMEKEMDVVWPEEVTDTEKITSIDTEKIKEKIRQSTSIQTENPIKMIKCNKCGKELPTTAKFCNNCGNKLLE